MDGYRKIPTNGEIDPGESPDGMGPLIVLEMTKDVAAPTVAKCLENGLLLNAVRPIRFMLPLTVTNEEIARAVDILDAALATTGGG
jgi:4-aminobutyrate aminotransferase-like enzyme